MDTEFEKGKSLIIEGIEGLMRTYDPAIKLFRGLQLLGITEPLGEFVKVSGDIEVWESLMLALDTFLGDFKKARNMEEVRETIDSAREFIKRLF